MTVNVNKISQLDFDALRRWFNQSFKLTVNGKYKGLSTLKCLLGDLQFSRFIYKLEKLLRGRGRYLVPMDTRSVLRVSNFRIILYMY